MSKNLHFYTLLTGGLIIVTALLLAAAAPVHAQGPDDGGGSSGGDSGGEGGGEGGSDGGDSSGGIFGEGGLLDNLYVSNAEGQAALDSFDLTLVDSITVSYDQATGTDSSISLGDYTIPGLGDIGLTDITYNVFINADGQYVVTADAFSFAQLTINDIGVFGMEPAAGNMMPAAWDALFYGALVNGYTGEFGLGFSNAELGEYMNEMAQYALLGNDVDVSQMPEWLNDYYNDLSDFGLGEGIGWDELWWLINEYGLGDFNADVILMYGCNPISGYADSCDNQNDEEEDTTPEPQPTPVPVYDPCPSNERITYGGQTAEAYLVDPKYVLVVGQDPEKRGADLYFKITVTPDIREWQEWEYETEEYCEWVGDEYRPWLQGDCEWGEEKRERIIDQWCEQKIQYFPRLASNQLFSATLDGDSRAWIQGELAARYPGADLLHPDWSWGSTYSSCHMEGYTHACEALIPYVQVEDPGLYLMSITADISGTPFQPAIPGLGIDAGSFKGYLLEAIISQ